MASARNLAWLRETGRRYIVGAPKAELKRFAAALAEPDGWRVVQEGVEVKLAHDPDTAETVILCRSADRRSKEQAMHDRFSQRIEAALQRLAGRIARAKKPLDAAAVNRQIGRLMQRNQRAAARFVVQLQPDANPAGFHLLVARSAGFDDWAALSEGAYLLRSNIADWSDRQLWKAYIQLTQAEAAFRIQKDQLNVRPIWHQREDRVQAHILVCFLAFVLWKCLEMWQSRAGLGNTQRTILEELARIQSHDVALPTATHGVIRLRCVTRPMLLRPRCSIASAWRCPNACAETSTRCGCSPRPPEPGQKCSGDFFAKCLSDNKRIGMRWDSPGGAAPIS
jgi:hypothetical protein